MMGEFKEELRDGFIEACLHLVNRDFDSLATDFVTLGYLLVIFLVHFYEVVISSRTPYLICSWSLQASSSDF